MKNNRTVQNSNFIRSNHLHAAYPVRSGEAFKKKLAKAIKNETKVCGGFSLSSLAQQVREKRTLY
jgi:hypothetical protein